MSWSARRLTISGRKISTGETPLSATFELSCFLQPFSRFFNIEEDPEYLLPVEGDHLQILIILVLFHQDKRPLNTSSRGIMTYTMDPEIYLIMILITPKLIHFGVYFAIDGFKNDICLTHFGMRKGILAKVYAVFYGITAIVMLINMVSLIKRFFGFSSEHINLVLFTRVHSSFVGLFMIGVGIFAFVFAEIIIRVTFAKKNLKSKKYFIPEVRRMSHSMILPPFALGLPPLFNLPGWVSVAAFTLVGYISPFTSPGKLKRFMLARDEIMQGNKNAKSRNQTRR
ncbi:MAG: hypothetical protein AAGU05_08435 [Anaerolineaceae bacterium]